LALYTLVVVVMVVVVACRVEIDDGERSAWLNSNKPDLRTTGEKTQK
jgi:hypothetical protein